MRKLTESDSLKFKNLSAEEKARRGILGRLYGPVAGFAAPTRNGRKYSQELWEKLFNSDLIKERFANGGIFGQLCHPDYEEIDFEKVAVCMQEPPVKDNKGQLIGYVDILDTPCGRIAYQLAKYGYKFGISSRGTGDIIEGYDGDEVDPDTYQLNAFDLVEIPAMENARLSFVESLNTKKYGKTLKEKLDEELNNASDSDKKLMTEALDDLCFKIDEANNDHITLNDIDEDKYPYLSDAINQDLVSLVIHDNTITNEKFDETSMEEAEIDSLAVKDDIERFAEHNNLEFQFNANYSENNGDSEDDYPDDELLEAVDSYLDKISMEWARNKKAEQDSLGESFDPAGITRVLRAISDGIETDEDEEGLTDYLSQIVGYCKSIADDYNLYIPAFDDMNESCKGSDIKEVVDDQSEDTAIIAELQESLAKVKQLEADNLSLQEKLSVGNAKVAELKEQLTKYKKATTRLSEETVKVKEFKNTLQENEKTIANNKQIIEKLSKSELSANMKLNEANESLDKYKAENQKLTENLNNANNKLTKLNDLVGKYKKSYAALKESYLNIKVTNYGLKKDEVKQKLGESYKIKDIDSVCEELSRVKTNISKLPFRITEDTKISVKGAKESIKTINDDDYISDSLKNMIY